MLKKLLKLTFSILLNHGVRKSEVTDLALEVEEKDGVCLIGTGAILTIQTKRHDDLTPKEKLRKNLIMIFLITFAFMIILSTVGILLPMAGFGRMLVLLSEIPAFTSALASARLFIRRPKRTTAPSDNEQKLVKEPIVLPN
jgi:hypothetical protein